MWSIRVATALVVGAGFEAALIVGGMGPRILLVASITAILAAVIWLLKDVGETTFTPEWPTAQPAHITESVEWRVSTLRTLLMNTQRSEGSNIRLHDLLVGLVDDRLVSVHGIDRAMDPGLAAQRLGPELTALMTAPRPNPQMTEPRTVERLVSQIEHL